MVNDLAERQRALDPSQSFIVQAPAGSGKTGLLVYRFLTLLGLVESPQAVLAITFTRKATAEMRERVQELLIKAHNMESGKDAFEQEGIDIARGVLANDARRGWQLLQTPQQLSIMTIDAFCARLSGSMPWLSRLGDRPRPTDDASAHYDIAVENVLRDLLKEHTKDKSPVAQALNTVLAELDFDYHKARTLFSKMLAKREQWLRHLFRADLASMRSDLEAAWQSLFQQYAESARNAIGETHLHSLCELVQFAANNQGEELASLTSFESVPDSVEQWQALVGLCLTKSGAWRRQVTKKQGFPAGADQTKAFKQLLADFADNHELLEAFLSLQKLPSPAYSSSDWQQLLALEVVLKTLAGELQLRFGASGECDHSEVTQRANFALSELGGGSDLSVNMSAEIKHILVDEFQDTSYGQIELLKKLTQSWNEQQSLFLVGDPMQSIYRFREAQVSLFLQVVNNHKTRILPQVNIEYLSLEHNFRSSAQLVDWFNATFSQTFPSQNNVMHGAIRYRAASANKPGIDSPVQAYLSETRASEAQLICELVQQSLLSVPENSKLAVLVRSRRQLAELVPALKARHIEFTGIDIQALNELPAVLDLVSLCLAIARQDDRIAWMSLLRSPWLGLNLAELTALSDSTEPTIWLALQRHGEAIVRTELHARLSHFIMVMTQALSEFQVSSLAQLCRWAWQQLGGPATLLGASLADIETVLGVIAELERGGDLPSANALEQSLEHRYANTAEQAQSARVVVSTMHKAKGLQYHTVILPSLANPPKSEDKDLLMWAEAQAENGDTQLFLAPLLGHPDKGAHFDFLRSLEAKRSQYEAARLLYVAATRAEQQLILTANLARDSKNQELAKAPTKRSLLASIWPGCEAQFSYNQLSFQEVEAVEPRKQAMDLLRLPKDYQAKFDSSINWRRNTPSSQSEVQAQEVIEFEWATEVATAVGVVLHNFLQHHSHEILSLKVNSELRARWRDELRALRVPFERLSDAERRLVQAVSNIQSDANAAFVFASYSDAQNEVSLAAHEQGQVKYYRLDRTFSDQQGQRWIVDYKSTFTRQADVASFAKQQVAERHKDQLEHYGRLYHQLNHHQGVTQPIQLAVYFPLLQQLVSWPFAADPQ